MLIRPELEALRIDGGPQRHAQAAMRAATGRWRETPDVLAVQAALAAYDKGGDVARLPALAALMSFRGALAYVRSFLAETGSALCREPLGHIALRHAHDDHRSSLILARAGRATLSLETRIAASAPNAAQTCVFVDIESRDVVLAGAMEGRLIHAQEGADGARLSITPLALRKGATCLRRDRTSMLVIDRVDPCLTMLRLQRRPRTSTPAKAYAIDSGALVGQASANADVSRHALMVALLGRMGRSEHASILAQIARSTGDCHLRKEAVRECLGLDTAIGFRLLGGLAARIDDPIRPDAANLEALLLAQFPQLLALKEPLSCPA